MRINTQDKNFKIGMTTFLVIVCSILIFFAVYRFDIIQKYTGIIIGILAPFIYGLVMAYLLCPIYNFIVRHTYGFLSTRRRKHRTDLGFSKALGTIVALAFLFIVVSGILWMIIPSLIDSLVKIIDILPSSMESFKAWMDVKLLNFPIAQETLDAWINNFTDNAIKYATEIILPEYGDIVSGISSGVIGIVSTITDLLIGVIICVYFLNSKDTFAAQTKKIIVAFFKEDKAEKLFEGASFTNKTFGGFINGKIIDSMIVGLICFVVMNLFGWEYALLISCIIGITNIIPFFGPFIGAIPSALLLLMVDPRQCIYFLIFILILQQFDGNILGPKILGDSTGLASFWVLFAAIVGGGFFGFVGMVVSIPVFAVVYYYISMGINRRLEKRGYSTDLKDYKIDSYRVKNPRGKLFSGKTKINKVTGEEGDGDNDN